MGYWNDPAKTAERYKPLPRNPNGKIDRKRLATEFVNPFVEGAAPRAVPS